MLQRLEKPWRMNRAFGFASREAREIESAEELGEEGDEEVIAVSNTVAVEGEDRREGGEEREEEGFGGEGCSG